MANDDVLEMAWKGVANHLIIESIGTGVEAGRYYRVVGAGARSVLDLDICVFSF